MNKQGSTYTFLYSIILVVVVAALLSFIALGLQPIQNENRENEKRQNILWSINISSTADNSEELFNENITDQFVVNSRGEKVEGDAFVVDVAAESQKPCEDRLLPVYVANIDGKSQYILPIYGKGLWGPLWGYISLEQDKNTIYGAIFDHKGETPGLGAEITTSYFQDQFKGKQIFQNGRLVSVQLRKGSGNSGMYEVDAISGGTITSQGVQNMILNYLSCYEPFLKKQ